MSLAVQKAVESAQRSTGLNIPVSFAAVADAPYDFEDRLFPIPGLALERLTVVVPERHDLVLMKTLRGYQHDIEVIEQIHRRQLLVFEVLRSRWRSSITCLAASGPRRFDGSLIADAGLSGSRPASRRLSRRRYA